MDEQLSQLGADLKALLKQLKAQEKTVSELAVAARDGDGRSMLAALAALDNELLARIGRAEAGSALVTAARERLDQLRKEQRRGLLHDLEAACTESGRAFRRLGDSPPELLLAPFTVSIDLSALEAVISYAREELARAPAEAGAIIEAIKREEKTLLKRHAAQPPEPSVQLFQDLLAAYRGLLGRRGQPLGTRVDLVDILPEVALLQQSTGFRANPVRERFRTCSRAQFLYDLAQLRAARILEQDGFRLDLGTATGDSVRRKSRVFFIQDANGQGQYYLSLRFVQR